MFFLLRCLFLDLDVVVVLVVENGEAGCFLFSWRLDPQIGETRLK